MTRLDSPRAFLGDAPADSAKASEESAAFRSAMRELASGVAIVTSGRGDAVSGCVATSVTSLSVAPPTMLICLSLGSTTLARVREFGAYAVNLLGGQHHDLIGRFSGRDNIHGLARFELGDWAPLASGAPILGDALAAFDCRVEQIIEHRTHAILIGAVEAIRHDKGNSPLVHWRGRSSVFP